MRDHPRQIYTSVRKPGGLSVLIATKARAVFGGLAILVLAVIVVAIVSFV